MKILIILLLSLVLFSCTEKFDVDIANKEKIVIEGVVIDSDTLNSYVRITRTGTSDHDAFYSKVTDALVIISDDFGQKDTLQYIDTFYYEGTISYLEGFYFTNNFKAKANRTYHLYVKEGEEEYTASTFMPTTVSIDSMYIPGTDLEVYNNGVKIFFKDPKEHNYYLIYFIQRIYSWFYNYDISILDDRFLPNNVSNEGYVVEDKFYPYMYFTDYTQHPEYNPYNIAMCSLTKDSYDYLRSLGAQRNGFWPKKNNTGAFSPSPATPKGNISNGALGFFRASSISFITGVSDGY